MDSESQNNQYSIIERLGLSVVFHGLRAPENLAVANGQYVYLDNVFALAKLYDTIPSREALFIPRMFLNIGRSFLQAKL